MQHTILPSSIARTTGEKRFTGSGGRVSPMLGTELRGGKGVAVRFTNRFFWFAAIACSLAISLWGQETTASIAGVVSDPTGALLPNAQVTATNIGTGASFRATSNASGDYVFRTLPVGAYRLSAVAPGFKRFEAVNVPTQVNEVTRVDISMLVGDVSESVEVTTAVVNVNTEDASLRTVVDQRRVEDLPLNGRDPVQLMRLVAGVSLYNGSGLTSGTTYPAWSRSR